MNVLLIGANGFIGRHVSKALREHGHRVVRGVRAPSAVDEVRADFASMQAPAQWARALEGVEAVVNAAGVFREHAHGRFADVHEAGPRALFAACEASGVRRVVQVSALGADEAAASGFHLSKRRGDLRLSSSALDWAIVYPSLVFGRGGESARLFATLASLPLVPLPGRGGQRVQPVHADDLAAAIVRLVEEGGRSRRIEAVGPKAVTLREWLALLRRQQGRGPACFVPVPLPVVRLYAGAEAIAMLERGNTAAPEAFARLLGRAPRAIEEFVTPNEGSALGLQSRLQWLLPVLRWSLALLWVWSGVVSLGLYPVESSLAMVARTGLNGPLAYAALFAGAAADIALGVATIALRRGRRWLWRGQFAFVGVYTLIITFALPELWLHPFGPVLKNLPIMAIILLLHELEPEERWST